jgi:hypothetical protein
MKTDILIFEDTPKYDLWLKLILGGTLALTFILGIIFIYQDTEAAIAMFGITIFDALLFKTILPRRFQIYEDRLKIILGGPFAINIPFSNIVDAKSASGKKLFFYWGSRFATSTHHVVEIVQKKGLNLVISPRNDDVFLERLNQNLQTQ